MIIMMNFQKKKALRTWRALREIKKEVVIFVSVSTFGAYRLNHDLDRVSNNRICQPPY